MDNQNNNQAPEKLSFSTEVQQLLHLMVHSLYSNKEIFLRELVSNASDALDTLRFLSLMRPELATEGGPREATIAVLLDKETKTLSVRDTGIGMTKQQVIEHLGTIARSGTGALLKQIKQQREAGDSSQPLDVIGQFGVGFYSVLMVASKVEVDTLSAEPSATPVLFSCDGSGTYTLSEGVSVVPGTTVRLFLNDSESEYLESWRIEEIIKRYSNYVKWPVLLDGKQLNRATALWAKRPNEVTEDEYNQFYRELTGGFPADEKPFGKVHLSFDSPVQFQAIVFIPRKPPLDFLVEQNRRRGVQLFVRRVFILEQAEELLPSWLRFVRGVVDSEDLPLNVSREILQKNQGISTIQRQIVKKVLEELKRLREQKPEEYRAFYEEFGTVLKEGIALDHGNREKIVDVCLWSSLQTPEDQYTTMAEYVAKMPTGQEEIYFITGPSRLIVEGSPHIEVLQKRKVDVLLLTDPIDEWVAQALHEYAGKRLCAIHKGDFKPPEIVHADEPVADAEPKTENQNPGQAAEVQALLSFLRVRFQDRLKEVRSSARLTESASVLVSDQGDWGPHLEELLRRAGRKFETQKPILEVNMNNPLVTKLAHLLATVPDSPEVGAFSDLLLDLAYLAQGSVPKPARLLSAVQRGLIREIADIASKETAVIASAK